MIISRSPRRERPIPFEVDLGNLLCSDLNPVPPSPTSADLASISQDCAQALVKHILVSGQIRSSASKGTVLLLPQPTTRLPRGKPLPKPKAETKWERFARLKGIKPRSRGRNMSQVEEGRRERNCDPDNDWLVEVDERKEEELDGAETVRSQGRRERNDRVRKNERQRRDNDRRAEKRHRVDRR